LRLQNELRKTGFQALFIKENGFRKTLFGLCKFPLTFRSPEITPLAIRYKILRSPLDKRILPGYTVYIAFEKFFSIIVLNVIV